MRANKRSEHEQAAEMSDRELDAVSGGYQLQRCFVTSWSISGDADDRPTEEVTFYYNKLRSV